MSNEIQIFKNKKFGNVRVLVIDEEEWFVGKDIATALGYKDTSGALKKHVDTEDRVSRQISDQLKRLRNTYLINESGFYCLVLNSKLKGAKEFKRWVTKEVLPTIRKTGAYITDSVWDQITNDPAKFGEFLIDYGKTKDELKQVKAKNDILMHTEKTYTVTEIAKELGVSSARILNQILFKDHIQYYMNGTWVLYSPYADKGYTVTKQAVKEESDTPIYYTRWTQLGREFLLNKYNN